MAAGSIHPIYSFEDYRHYISETLSSPPFERGARLKLAKFLNCQPSFISQMLSGKNELSLDHAHKVNLFLNHGNEESVYFINLVLLSKAASFELQRFFRTQLSQIKDQQMQIHKVVQKKELDREDLINYYANWLCISIHMLVTIPTYQNPLALQQKLGASDLEFKDAVNFLTRTGLIQTNEGRLEIGEAHLHLKKTSPIAQSASVMTRLKVLEKMKLSDPTAVNFSSNFTISASARAELKKKILDFIVQLDDLIQRDDPEEFCTLTLDLITH